MNRKSVGQRCKLGMRERNDKCNATRRRFMRKEASQPFGGSPGQLQERPDKKETGEEQILGG